MLAQMCAGQVKKKTRGLWYRPQIEPLEERTLLSTDTWTGGGGANTNWSNPANWDTGSTPAPGDTLDFSTPSSGVLVNDLTPGTPFFGLGFGVGVTIQGNPIVLTGGGIGGGSSGAFINLSGITLTADQGFNGAVSISSVVSCNGFTLSTSAYSVFVPWQEGGGYYQSYTGEITGTVYAGHLNGDWSIQGPISLSSTHLSMV